MRARHIRHRRAIAVVPTVLLCALVSPPVGGGSALSADTTSTSTSTPAPSVPTEAIEAPASVSSPDDSSPVAAARTVPGSLGGVAQTASASGIPAAALAAYQRAETVINVADTSCDLSWQLIAAIGQVESGHGTAHGNSLDDEGLATPGIFGIALDGDNNTQGISDTDAGQYDSDTRWDRAVGPMQFIPSTWSVVGVDGDNDGKRNPQDIDDAALASAVYLCSGKDDLSTDAGQRASVFRYNHSNAYVDLVLSLMEGYLSSDVTTVSSTTSYAAAVVVSAPAIARSTSDEGSLRSALVPATRHETELVDPPESGDDAGPGSDAGTPVEPTPEPELEPEPEPEVVPEPEVAPEPEVVPGPTDPTEPTPEPEPSATTEEEATEECLVVVGATDVIGLEQLGLLDDFTSCMAELGFLEWSTP